MAAVEVLSIPEIAAKVVAFTAKALLVCPAAARHHPLVLSVYERSVLEQELPDLELVSDDDFLIHPCIFCRLSQP